MIARLLSHIQFAVARFLPDCVFYLRHAQAEEITEYLANYTKNRNQLAVRECCEPKTSVSDLVSEWVSEWVKHAGENSVRQ